MKHNSRIVWIWLVAAASAPAVGCQKQNGDAVRIDGSSTVFPITEAVAKEFEKADGGKVSVNVSGTSGGFKKFCAGEIDIAGASRPVKPSEVEPCGANGVEFVEVPIAYDGIAVLVHPKNTWATQITTDELRKIWEPEAQGKVTKWNQIRAEWPDQELHLYGAGVESGTYDYFTQAIVQKEHSSRTDFTSSEDDNVLVENVARDELSLGFFGYAYYLKNKGKLRAVAVDDGKPENGPGPILPSIETVRIGIYQPLSRPLFLYVAKKSLDRLEVTAFVTFYLERGRRLVDQVGYISLPNAAYALGIERVSARRVGSIFGGKGSQVGVSIEQLLHKEVEP